MWVDFDINERFRSLIVKWQVGTKYSVNKNERTARKDKIILPWRHTQNKEPNAPLFEVFLNYIASVSG